MNKQLGELTIKKSADYYNKVVNVLEDAGFVIVLLTETTTDRYYIVAESEKYCDRNICVSNEYNGIGCNECEVTKSREPKERSDKE